MHIQYNSRHNRIDNPEDKSFVTATDVFSEPVIVVENLKPAADGVYEPTDINKQNSDTINDRIVTNPAINVCNSHIPIISYNPFPKKTSKTILTVRNSNEDIINNSGVIYPNQGPGNSFREVAKLEPTTNYKSENDHISKNSKINEKPLMNFPDSNSVGNLQQTTESNVATDITQNIDCKKKIDIKRKSNNNPEVIDGNITDMESIISSAFTSKQKPKLGELLISYKWRLFSLVLFLALYFLLLWDSVTEEETIAEESNFHTHNIPLKTGPNTAVEKNSDIKVQLWINKVDPFRKQVEAQVYFFPSRRIISPEDGGIIYKVAADFIFLKEVYEKNATMKPVSLLIPIVSGNPYLYPFEIFRTEFDIKLTKLPSGEPVPINVDIMALTPAMWFDINRLDNSVSTTSKSTTKQITLSPNGEDIVLDNSFYSFELVISRPKNIILFSVFVVLILWAFTGAILALANSVYSSDARPGAPYLGLGPALIFAMPNMRASQPGIPPIGILIDVLGFIWNIVLVSMASIVLICIWIERRDTVKHL